MSRRKDMSSKLKSSLQAEDESLDERFAKADVALGTKVAPASRKKRKKKVAAPKVVRDTFSMPEDDHRLIQEIRHSLVKEHDLVLNKSEILRAGLHALKKMPSKDRLAAAQSIEIIKPGRRAL